MDDNAISHSYKGEPTNIIQSELDMEDDEAEKKHENYFRYSQVNITYTYFYVMTSRNMSCIQPALMTINSRHKFCFKADITLVISLNIQQTYIFIIVIMKTHCLVKQFNFLSFNKKVIFHMSYRMKHLNTQTGKMPQLRRPLIIQRHSSILTIQS